MRHVEKALLLLKKNNPSKDYSFIEIENSKEEKGIAPTLKFKIQSDPIKEVGVNGIQAVDVLEYVKFLFESLNENFPCEENLKTILKIEEAINFQKQRTEDRLKRGVEGINVI